MNYTDLINIDDLEKRENFNFDRGEVSFYCKDCEEKVEVEKIKKNKYEYKCKKCNGKNIVIGTDSGIKENYRIK